MVRTKRGENVKKYIYLLLIGVLAAGTVLSLHDMQVSEGIGLYFAIKLGKNDRRIFDILADMVVLIGFFLLTWIPFRSVKKTPEHFFRIMVSYLALMPGISTAHILHFITEFSAPYVENRETIMINLETTVMYTRTLLFGTVILGGAYLAIEGGKLCHKHIVYILCAGLLLAAGILCGAWTEVTCFAGMYAIFLLFMEFWKKLTFPGWPLYVVLFLRCIYNFYEVMAKYV